LEVAGRRGRGRGQKMWRKCVAEDLGVLGLEEHYVQNTLKWRSDIMGKPSDTHKHTTDVKSLKSLINTALP
jgi:hypothetical protein